MLHKRKESDVTEASARHRGSASSMQEHHLAHQHYRRIKKQECCPTQLLLIFCVAIYMVVGFLVSLLSAASIVTSGDFYMTDEEFTTFKLRTDLNPGRRSDRFPSIEDRVKFYMSDWYLQPCNADDKLVFSKVHNGNFTIIRVDVGERSYDFYGVIQRNVPLYLDPSILSDCTSSFANLAVKAMTLQQTQTHLIDDKRRHRAICADLEELIPLKPSLAILGEVGPSIPIPVFSAARYVAPFASNESCRTKNHPSSHTFSPILWRLSSRRQFDMLVSSRLRDTPWHKKTPIAVFRESGQLMDTKEDCFENQVCRFIIQHAKSKRINAGYELDFRNPEPRSIDGIVLSRGPLGMRSMQSHKILIDFTTGQQHDNGVQLAWKLYSSSVLLMPLPTQTTWLMEGLLQPWTHFIPLNDTNAEEMVQWVIDNDMEAHRISERASLFIHDLLLHPQALIDEVIIKQQMIERYQAHWS